MRTVIITAIAAIAAVPLLAPALAHADQCAIVDTKLATDALALARASGTALALCEPCGDTAPKVFPTATIVSKGDRLVLGTKVLDLAYTFVKTGPKEWKNLALAVGCRTTGVSAYVRDGKPSGPVSQIRTPPPRPLGPPPMPPSAPRATSPDELVGSWSVRTTTWTSSCPPRPGTGDERWDISLANDAFTITTSDHLVFEGTAAPLTHGSFTHSLRTRQLPSSTVLKLTHAAKDRFYATIIRAEPLAGRSDPMCVVQLNVTGQRT